MSLNFVYAYPKLNIAKIMLKVLIIEDNNAIAEMYKIAFTKRHHMVELAGNGQDGLKKAQEQIPAIILLDIMLPGKDGFQVIVGLKAHPLTKDIPVFIVTNLSDPTIQKKMADSGAQKFLVKSDYLPDQIVDVVEKHFNPEVVI